MFGLTTNEDRGLASAGEETKERVAREGGKVSHEKRGLQAADEETREEVARKGGQS
jgi:general stress protein YciG